MQKSKRYAGERVTFAMEGSIVGMVASTGINRGVDVYFDPSTGKVSTTSGSTISGSEGTTISSGLTSTLDITLDIVSSIFVSSIIFNYNTINIQLQKLSNYLLPQCLLVSMPDDYKVLTED